MEKVLFLSVVLISTVSAHSQENPANAQAATVAPRACADTADAKAIRQIAERWKHGYNRGDAAGVASLYAMDAYYLTQHFVTGIIHGRPAIQAYVQRGVDAH